MDGTQPRIVFPWECEPDPGAAIEVAEGVLWMRLPLPLVLNHVNIYALDDGDGWTVVDTGMNTGKSRGVWTELLGGPLRGKPVTRVLGTHHHPDHIGLVGWFIREHGTQFLTSRTSYLMARMLTLDEQPVPDEQSLAFWRSAGMAPDILRKRAESRPMNFADVVAPIPLGYGRLVEGQTFHAGGRTWDVRMGGGHAPEHVTLWSQDGDLVIGGDQLLPGISANVGVYATEPEGDPLADWLDACERLSGFATEAQLVLPGHKLPYRGLPLRLSQMIDNHHGCLERLERHLAEPRVATDCFAPLFKRTIGEGEYGLALVESMAHCLHLWHQGRATRTRRADGAWLWQAAG